MNYISRVAEFTLARISCTVLLFTVIVAVGFILETLDRIGPTIQPTSTRTFRPTWTPRPTESPKPMNPTLAAAFAAKKTERAATMAVMFGSRMTEVAACEADPGCEMVPACENPPACLDKADVKATIQAMRTAVP